MDDDNADWFAAADEPAPAPAPAAGKKAAAPASKKAAAEAPDAAAEAPADEAPPPKAEAEAVDEYLDPDKLLLFKHWIRLLPVAMTLIICYYASGVFRTGSKNTLQTSTDYIRCPAGFVNNSC